MAKQKCQSTVNQRTIARRGEYPTRALHRFDSSQELVVPDRRIGSGHAIASGQQTNFVHSELVVQKPVNKEAVVPHKKHNLARLDLTRSAGLDNEGITGPQSWEHAHAGGAQP